MRHNGRPPLVASQQNRDRICIPYAIVCPRCNTWRGIERHMIKTHHDGDAGIRCPGSGQRITFP